MIIQNLDSLSSNQRRRMILESLPPIFEKLDPENVCRNSGEEIEIPTSGKLYIVGFGKASLKMYRGIRDALKRKVDSGWVIIPDDQNTDPEFPELKVLYGTHPKTGVKTVSSTRKVIDSMKNLNEDDTVIVLISGGGSALFEMPVEGISIGQIAEATECLMNADADIYELNSFRRFFSSVKGGRLAKYLRPAKVISLVISDVFGDDPSYIASGPLSRPSNSENTIDKIVVKFGQKCPMISKMAKHADETEPDPSDFLKVAQKIILKNRDFVDEVCKTFDKWGVDYVNLGSNVNGDVEEVSGNLIQALRYVWSIKGRPFWFVFGGETTVNVMGDGMGGRNQELALRILQLMGEEDFVFMAIGTDGIDGKSPAMGAIVDGDLRRTVTDVEITKYLSSSDSFSFLENHGSAIITGRTGNNVSDLALGYIDFGRGRRS